MSRGPDVALERDQRRERHHLAALRAHPEPLHVLGARAQVALGLREDAEDAPEAVEVVDVEPPMNAWSVSKTSLDATPSVLRLGAVEVDADCGAFGAEGREERCELGGASPRSMMRCVTAAELARSSPPAVLELELEAARRARARGSAAGSKAKTARPGSPRAAAHVREDRVERLLLARRARPRARASRTPSRSSGAGSGQRVEAAEEDRRRRCRACPIRIFSTCVATASVRSSEAPSGSWKL